MTHLKKFNSYKTSEWRPRKKNRFFMKNVSLHFIQCSSNEINIINYASKSRYLNAWRNQRSKTAILSKWVRFAATFIIKKKNKSKQFSMEIQSGKKIQFHMTPDYNKMFVFTCLCTHIMYRWRLRTLLWSFEWSERPMERWIMMRLMWMVQ
jgi:hypothetical protein